MIIIEIKTNNYTYSEFNNIQFPSIPCIITKIMLMFNNIQMVTYGRILISSENNYKSFKYYNFYEDYFNI
jgi:hypothetical protein